MSNTTLLCSSNINPLRLREVAPDSLTTSRITLMAASKFPYLRIRTTQEVAWTNRSSQKMENRVTKNRSRSEVWTKNRTINQMPWWRRVRVDILDSETSRTRKLLKDRKMHKTMNLQRTTTYMKNRQTWGSTQNFWKIFLACKPTTRWATELRRSEYIWSSNLVTKPSSLLIST